MTDHGGNLGAALTLFPDAPKPWVDLSTGINPHSYPVSDMPASVFARLPEPSRALELQAAAAAAYGAPSGRHVVAAPGTQILMPLVARLVAPGRARVLAPTYAEHARCAALAGHAVEEAASLGDLEGADLAILVNPNNPDGRVARRKDLLELAGTMRRRGGILVVDEAFMDVGPADDSLAGHVGEGGLVVLRSFGKFFGLAGVRLGFALANEVVVRRLRAELGPWVVSGPALEIGLGALADPAWQADMRERLAREASALDVLLSAHGLEIAGGTSLFRLARSADAQSLFERLGRRGILVRRFANLADRLRFGLPAGEAERARLEDALTQWREKE